MSLRWTASLYSTYFIKNWFWHMWRLSAIFYFAPWWLSGEVQSVINERVICTKSFFSTWNLLSSWFFPTWIFSPPEFDFNLKFKSFFFMIFFSPEFLLTTKLFSSNIFFPSEFWFTSIYGILNFFSPLEIFFFLSYWMFFIFIQVNLGKPKFQTKTKKIKSKISVKIKIQEKKFHKFRWTKIRMKKISGGKNEKF